MGHSNIGPSGAERFFACPGSVEAQAKIDIIEPSNQAALEGLAMHELAARCLLKNLDPYEFLGETIEVKDNYEDTIEFTVNDDFIFTVRMYRNTILNILQEHGLDSKALQVETHFNLPEIDDEAKGTTDCSFIASDTLYVFDLKGGRGIIINPVENKQCMYYALRPYLNAKVFIKRIVIGIIQPRAKEGDFIKMWETSPERIEQFILELKTAINKTRNKNLKYYHGKWCKYCKAQGNCPAVHNDIVNQLQVVIPDINRALPQVTDLSPEQIGKALPALEVLKGVIDTLMGYAFTLASKGEDVPNYTLTRTKPRRKYRDEQAVIQTFSEIYGEEIYNIPKLRTPAQLEKIVGKEELNDFVFVPEGDLKLVPTEEAKEFVKRSVQDVFENVQID